MSLRACCSCLSASHSSSHPFFIRRLHGKLTRMIHTPTSAEVNLVSVFQLYSYQRYLPAEQQGSLDLFLQQSEPGRRLAARRAKERTRISALTHHGVSFVESSKRGTAELSSDEMLHARELARRAFPEFGRLCDEYETLGLLEGKRRPLPASSDLARWCSDADKPADLQLLASGAASTARVFHSAIVNGVTYGGFLREGKRLRGKSSNAGFMLEPAASRESKTVVYGRVLCFLEVAFGGRPLLLARVDLFESSGFEARTLMPRVNLDGALGTVKHKLVLASSLMSPVAFADAEAGTQLRWVLSCGRL